MSLRAEFRRTAPWVLCAVSLSMYVLSNVLRWLLRDQVPAPHTGWLEGTIGALGFAGIPIVGAVMVARLPGNPYGWVWCAAGLAYGVSEVGRPRPAAGGARG